MNSRDRVVCGIGLPVAGMGLVDKQNGVSGMYGRVDVTVCALGDGDTENRITNGVVGATIPTDFIGAVIDGVGDALVRGPINGYPVTGVEVRIVGGKAHVKDSNAHAFREAGRLAVQDALCKSDMALLEPVATLEVTLPPEFVGAVVGDINSCRDQITNTTTRPDGWSVVTATVPMSETFGYATDLRSMTQSRASFAPEPSGDVEAPASVRRRGGSVVKLGGEGCF